MSEAIATEGSAGADWDLSGRYAFDGHEIRYGAIGEGPPMVLVHGTPFSSLVWRRLAPWFARRRRVFYYDLLGYGRSAKPDADVSLGVQNRLLAELLVHWGVDRPDVAAHDFGGCTALRAHIIDGCDYRSLLLVDPVAIGPSGSPFVQACRDHEAVFAGLPAYMHEALLRAYLAGACFNALREHEMRLHLEPWLGAEGQAAFYRQIAQMDDRYTDEIERRFGEVRCPTMVLWGEKDEWIPIERGQELARRIPGAAFRSANDAKHLVQEDAPEAVMASALELMARADA